MDNDAINENLINLFEKSKVKIHLKDGGMFLANATISIGNVELRGWRIAKSKFNDDFWIQPPSHGKSAGNKALYSIWIDDDEINSIINLKLTEAYENEKAKREADSMPF